eukprot:TRINITY_DN3319_c1_g1_i1.p1 TRINITY_DN3319_c1_g1~~TRINITY_DN3319_c1_g1_i1.p1  ORF type:complete len:170 (+),score=42.83 TRINITY_DN3319_c1_g1_i1:28-510(+)
MKNQLRINKEIQGLHEMNANPIDGIKGRVVGDDINHLEAIIKGPPETPYESGVFLIDITIPERFPFDMPTFTMVTPCYHPNISHRGEICLDSIKENWKPQNRITYCLITIQQLLASPNHEHYLNQEAATLLSGNSQNFDSEVRCRVQSHSTVINFDDWNA